MHTHKEVFTDYLRNAPRYMDVRDKNRRVEWRDWLSDDKNLRQCDGCKRYGMYGEEVSCIPDDHTNPGVVNDGMYCPDCTVEAWAWTKDEMMLTVICPRGEEEHYLLEQARYFKDVSGLREWGYDGKKSHVKF